MSQRTVILPEGLRGWSKYTQFHCVKYLEELSIFYLAIQVFPMSSFYTRRNWRWERENIGKDPVHLSEDGEAESLRRALRYRAGSKHVWEGHWWGKVEFSGWWGGLGQKPQKGWVICQRTSGWTVILSQREAQWRIWVHGWSLNSLQKVKSESKWHMPTPFCLNSVNSLFPVPQLWSPVLQDLGLTLFP